MTSVDIDAPLANAAVANRSGFKGLIAPRPGYLFSPAIDFLGLGGLSLLVLPILAWLVPTQTARPDVALFAMILANFVNHPHFAHSYQIFYRGFRAKLLGRAFPPALRTRYAFAGLIVPLAIVAFFALCIALRAPYTLAVFANIMGLAVGWHYVKQGYGILMVCSVLKRCFFNDAEKRALLANGYAAWMCAWLYLNRSVAESDFWGLKYYALGLPDFAYLLAGGCLVATSLWVIVVLARKTRDRSVRLPYLGLMSYAITLYLWVLLALFHPLFLLIVPASHSLQYLMVVWRFQWNVESERATAAPARPSAMLMRFGGFVVAGTVLGFLGFWALPTLLQGLVPYDKAVFGGSLFLALFWLFINVHHYFIDNVIWRRENPETKKYLFR